MSDRPREGSIAKEGTAGESTAEKGSAKQVNAYKVAVARMWAVARQPYLAAALFAMPVVSAPGLSDGAAVDQEWRLYLDPEQVEKWSPEQLGSMLIHHAGHLLRDHAGRARQAGVSQSSSERWALAADAEINDDLVGAGLHPPTTQCCPKRWAGRPGGWRRNTSTPRAVPATSTMTIGTPLNAEAAATARPGRGS